MLTCSLPADFLSPLDSSSDSNPLREGEMLIFCSLRRPEKERRESEGREGMGLGVRNKSLTIKFEKISLAGSLRWMLSRTSAGDTADPKISL